MQFTCETKKLIEGLQIATKALSNRTSNPILEGILIETDYDDLVLTCSDDRMTIVTRIKANITDAGRGVVPGKLFSEIVRRLPDSMVSIEMDNRFIFTIRSATNRTNITGQDPDFFPRLPKMEDEREISLPQDILRDMIQKTEFAIAQDDMRGAHRLPAGDSGRRCDHGRAGRLSTGTAPGEVFRCFGEVQRHHSRPRRERRGQAAL